MAMALPVAFLSEDQFTCSICLDVFNNPVSTPCGHSFCQACISSYWDGGGKGTFVYECPLCKESFGKRPELQINRTLKEITEQFKQMANTGVPIDERGGGRVDVTNSKKNHHRLALSPPQRLGEMPETIFAEMMTRFQRLSTSGIPETTLPYLNDPHPQSPSPVNAQTSVHAQSNEHHEPPPPYSRPRRESIFEDLLNPTNMSSVEEVEWGEASSISMAEVSEVVKKLFSSKVPGVDEITPEMLKALDIVRMYTLSGPGDSSPNLPLCPVHLRGLEFFCRTDNTCVCCICMETAEHRGHSVIPAQREWHIKKSQLGLAEVELKDLICERERKVEEIQNSLREIKAASERETDGAVCVFSKLISSLEQCQAEILEVVEMSRRAAEHQAQGLLRELEEEIAELKNRSTELSQLALTEDYVFFLKLFPTLSATPSAKDWSSVSVVSELTSGVILRTVTQMMERFQEEMQKLPEVCQRSSLGQSVPRPNPKPRRVQEYAANITLDANTAHPRLVISADGKQVHCGDRHQLVPDNPERFDRVVCVLARQGFSSGQHYWEVEVGEKTDWDLGVASRSTNRKGKITVSPAHGYWFLSLRDRSDYAFRTEPSTALTVSHRPSRIGIYVDCDKGLLSFYDVEARLLIYTFTDIFSDTIHAFFSPCTNKSGRNKAPLTIVPVAKTE
ncbi:nuclear factor 7, ovary [Perca flavescens]|uniref:nuclear factor 7, ovary n=1 Tax=Perca flavescens TaxID=8167 RepID=UPI00106E74E5|nr:nuclear factor 7, ovary-like [Perca flavescens]